MVQASAQRLDLNSKHQLRDFKMMPRLRQRRTIRNAQPCLDLEMQAIPKLAADWQPIIGVSAAVADGRADSGESRALMPEVGSIGNNESKTVAGETETKKIAQRDGSMAHVYMRGASWVLKTWGAGSLHSLHRNVDRKKDTPVLSPVDSRRKQRDVEMTAVDHRRLQERVPKTKCPEFVAKARSIVRPEGGEGKMQDQGSETSDTDK
ncbi:hypothetical protein B0H21DRAFT_708270 [Amylocystis lapponica]|nr:hypothetical protein B0H21DRAFT_708270 [Amylocystis lapponica]